MPAYSEFIEDTPNLKIEKPYVTYPGLPIPKSNVVHKEYVLPNLTDVRTLAAKEKPTFDENGLVYLQHKSAAADALVSKDEQGPYWDEVTALLKAFLGVETVFPYALKMRGPEQSSPGNQCHSDCDEWATWPDVLARVLSEEEREAVRASKLRCRIVNVWRPLVNHAEDFPLALMDINSLDQKDLVGTYYLAAVDLEDKNYPTPAYKFYHENVKYNPSQRWYWMSNQTPDEPVVFTQWDTHPPKGEDQYNRTVHSAFRNSDAREGCPLRQSVETRMIVLEPAPYQRTKPIPGTEENPGPLVSDPRTTPWAPYLSTGVAHTFNATQNGRPRIMPKPPKEPNVGLQKRVNLRAEVSA